jgi:hypothetical protein
MSKELKWWILAAVAVFTLFVIVEAFNVAGQASNFVQGFFQGLLQAPGTVLQSFTGLFSGNGSSDQLQAGEEGAMSATSGGYGIGSQ